MFMNKMYIYWYIFKMYNKESQSSNKEKLQIIEEVKILIVNAEE